MTDPQWHQFMEFAALFSKTVDLDADEYSYKLTVSERLRRTREIFLQRDPEWFEVLRRDISSSGLMNQYFMMRLVDLGRTKPGDLWQVIALLWEGDLDTRRIDEFTLALRPYNQEQFSVGGIIGFASLLLMGRDPYTFPPYRAQAVKRFLKLVGWDDRGANGDPARRYELLLEALDEILRLAPEYGIQLRDRLDAQGLMWTVMNVDPTDEWAAPDRHGFRVWRGDKVDKESIPSERPFGPFPPTEKAARAIIDAGLLQLPSPFGGGAPTWTVENAEEIIRRVIDAPDIGEGKFLDKLEHQLSGAADGVIRLAAELVALQTLPLSNLTGSTRRARVNRVLSWLETEAVVPDEIDEGLSSTGAFHGGTGFNMYQWKHLGWLARLVITIRERVAEPLGLLVDPEQFLRTTQLVREDVQAIRYAVEYLAWPSYSEPIVSRGHRVRIRKAFAHVIGGESGHSDLEIARDLMHIQAAMAERDGHRIEWYDEPYRFEWLGHALQGQRAWLVRQNQGGVAMASRWRADEFVSTRAQHLGTPSPGSSYEEVQAAVHDGYQHIDYSERRVRALEYFRFLSQMKVDDFVLTAFESNLYLGVIIGEAEYADDETSRLRRQVAWRKEPIANDDLPAPLPRLLEEQGIVVDLTDGLSTITAWFEAEPVAGSTKSERTASQPAVVPKLPEATTDLATKLYVQRDDIQEVIRLLQTRQQIVFYGPPGTGKTYLAGKIARYLAGDEHGDHVKTVQFHPSYAYEDFFEGYRPVKSDGDNVGFSLEPGPLRRIAAEASLDGNRDKPYFLIIDEMNRGNLAKIFGELYFLLEYRDQGINLQYNPQQTFVLPPNLFIIGTMNTSDRSIAMVDAAIRRRFAFVELHPQEGMISGMLERFLETSGKPALRAELLNALNGEIEATNRDLMIGPSYFMKPHAESDQGLAEIWKYELLPLLEEQYFGRLSREKIRERFGLEAIRRKARLDSGRTSDVPHPPKSEFGDEAAV
ncbi:AAA family ATPase [Arthrobacter sp. efr-133-TYG-104]|uniref:McrB family protein n=1 Tax=Arthrobacter sp. efr-133-TYG-104 TaxID=3040324 RepID=UPI00254FBFDE|nr:AAA family ATPase [Arthrobacter sp. efr-133-TYG-104]